LVLVVLPAVGLLSGTVPPNLGVLIAIGLLVWIVALFLVITPFRLWKADQAAIGELRDLQRPRLGLEFDPKAGRPYLEESATDGEAREFLVRKFRVGIANLSNKTIDRVRVVLDDCDPQLANVCGTTTLSISWGNRMNMSSFTPVRIRRSSLTLSGHICSWEPMATLLPA